MTSFRILHDSARHLGWDPSLPPVLHVAPGDALELEVRDAGDGQITPDSGADAVAGLDPARANPLTGPVFVEGAEPGDTLRVMIEDVELSGWGWTAIIPGFGLLADELPGPFLLHTRHDARRVEFLPGIELPTRAFPGTLGVVPAAPGVHSAIPPRRVGGNLDARELVAGTRLDLPVEVAGALLSVGDTHAAQGRGEVCGTAIETPTRVRLRVELRKAQGLRGPELALPASNGWPASAARHVTLGVGPDLLGASRDALRAMIDYLGREHRLSAELAYALCSVGVDLAIEELVNAPNWVVSATLPLDLFV